MNKSLRSYCWPDEAVAWYQDETAVSVATVLTEVERLAEQLTAHPGRCWLLHTHCPGLYLVGLLALSRAGKSIVLPQHGQQQGLLRAAEGTDAWLSDYALSLNTTGVQLSPDWQYHPVVPMGSLELTINGATPVCMFTSGSTGQPKRIAKQLAQLLDEVAVLEESRFGGVYIDTLLLAVSHQHIYGLLFGVLWPFLYQRCAQFPQLHYAEQLVAALERFPHAALIASPATLRLLAESAALLSPVAPRLTFSSGGPLAVADAHIIEQVWAEAPYEILGSTETGGIAWRQQRAVTDAAVIWHPFPNVEWTIDEQQGLTIRSPLLSDPGSWWSTGDAARVQDDGFVLQGRLDRIVKLAEKRLSLDQMEHELNTHPTVAEAALVMLNGHRPQLGAVLVLSQDGIAVRERLGTVALQRLLREHLNSSFEAVTLPRRWRFVETLPRNAQGKRTAVQLEELFR